MGQIVDKVADAADAVETARATADIVQNGANVGNVATVAGAAIGAGSRAANRASDQASGAAQSGRNRVDEAVDDLESGRKPRRDNPDRPNPCAALGALDHAAAHAVTGGDCPNPNLPPNGETLDSGGAQFGAPKKVGVPPGFSNPALGNEIHQRFGNALQELTDTDRSDWRLRTAPGQNGVDATFIGDVSRYPGFKHAELKPYSYSGWEQFQKQVENWKLPERVRLFFYNPQGIIGESVTEL